VTTPPPWILDRNLVLQAGAGTGKTRSLVTVALHLLCGATARRASVPASRLVALTFTEKAGAEMRSRLLQRVTRLSDGTPLHADSPELAESLDWLGLPLPTQETWRRIRRDLPAAFIGTFHSFCAGQLRRLARPARIDAGFELMDEDTSAEVFDECSTDLVLERLAREDRGVRALVDEYDLSTERGGGVIDLVRTVLARIAEEGRTPESLDDGRFSDESARAGVEAAHARGRKARA
jgi:ATP-dependent exoDNAse (exonuclease V) beta subunit